MSICDKCETVAYCMKNGCIPISKAPAPEQQAPQGWKLVPVHPTPAHIDSIALRYRHDFGLLQEDQKENARRFARQMYEECTGQGFYEISASPAAPEAAKPATLSDFIRSADSTRAAIGARVVDAAVEMQQAVLAKPVTERAELPPLPKAVREMIKTHQPAEDNEWTVTSSHYTADQMRDYARAALLAADRKAVGEPDWNHPTIQGLIGADARNRITIDLIWKVIKNPECELTPGDMEYWDAIHDALKAALTRPQQQAKALSEIAEMIREAHDFSLDEMHTFAREKMLEAAALLDSSGIVDQA